MFLNDVSISELTDVLKVHKAFVKERFGSGDGKEAYVDAGDLGADPEKYASNAVPNGHSKQPADSLNRNGIKGNKVKSAAVAAGSVPVDGTGHVTNGVSAMYSKRYIVNRR